MTDPQLHTSLKTYRELAGLSQKSLAESLGVTRQTLSAIEAGRQSPSTTLALQLARALDCQVEDLFALSEFGELEVELVELDPAGPSHGQSVRGGRLTVARINDRYVAHHLPDGSTQPADALLSAASSPRLKTSGQALRPRTELNTQVLLAGCAPLLGIVAGHANQSSRRGLMTWLPQNTERALRLLRDAHVHAAGIHRSDQGSGGVEAFIAQCLPGISLQILNLARWRQGILVQHNHQGGIHELADLHRPGLKIARREAGSEASRLLDSGGTDTKSCLSGPLARSHEQVAQLVAWGVADAGIAIESVAISYGLKFIPLTEERFDIILRREEAYVSSTNHLLNALTERSFRDEAARLPGYDLSLCGESTLLEAAS